MSFLSIRHISYYLAIFVTYFDTHIKFNYYLCNRIQYSEMQWVEKEHQK